MPKLHLLALKLRKYVPDPIWPTLRAYATAFITPIRFSISTGHFRSSVRSRAMTHDGNATTWYSYPANDLLERRDYADKKILEFGGGQSSIWWGERSEFVLTIEANKDWYISLQDKLPKNVEIKHFSIEQRDQIEKFISDRNELFDVIIIDGHDREYIAQFCHKFLSPDGVIIGDNSDRYDIDSNLSESLNNRADLYGFAPGVSLRHCTSLYFGLSCFLFDRKYPVSQIEEP